MASSAGASSAIDAEYIGRLIKVVKETLAIVMRSANVAIDQNAEVDLGTKSSEGVNSKLERSLEEFYNACDQLQLCLGLMRETENQTQDSAKYTPKPVFSSRTENIADTQTYTEYLSTVRTQIAATKELHDMLSEFCMAQLP